MDHSTKKWLLMKICSVILIPLMFWFIIIGLAWSFSFHALNEIRHLIWDLGYGFDLKISKITGIITIVGSLALTVLIYLLGKNLI